MMKKNLFASPIAFDTSSFFLPWMVLVMVFFATVSLALYLFLNAFLSQWERSVSSSFSVQIVPQSVKVSSEKMREDIQAVRHLLMNTSGVKSADVVEMERVHELLKPWFGNTAILNEIPVPVLIDVQIFPNAPLDFKDLEKRLSQKVQGVSLDVHRLWFDKLLHFVEGLKFIAAFILVFVGAATALTVVYATVSSLETHRAAIEVLHQIGAVDAYIARIFAKRIGVLAGIGSFLGFLPALALITLVRVLSASFEVGMLSAVDFSWGTWISLSGTVVVGTGLSTATGYVTVLHKLKKTL